VVGTTDSWRGIYKTARPTLVNLLVDGADAETLARHHPTKLRQSTDLPGASEGEDYFSNHDGTKGMWGRHRAAPLRDADGEDLRRR